MPDRQSAVSIGLLRDVFASEFTPQLFAGVDTHEPALRLVAQLVRHTEDDNLLQAIVAAALPESYSGNTIAELPGMIASARRKGFDKEPAGPRRRLSPIDVLNALFAQQAVELFHSDMLTAYVGIPTSVGGVINAPIGSIRSNHFVQEVYYRATGKGLKERDLDDFNAHLGALAEFEGQRHVVNVRVGGSTSDVYHDLGRDDGAVVEVTADGYTVTYAPAVKLIRMSGMKALPLPEAGTSPPSGLMKFKKLLLLDDRQWPLVLAFLIGVLRPSGPYAFLAVEGEQGSGKSLRCELCKAVIDPGIPMRSSLPKSVQDLMIIANHSHVIIFDNLSGITAEMSDALAALSTKAGFRTRQLYTDAEVHAIEVTRPFMLNGIGDFIHRPDLMDRAIPLRLEAMSEIERRTEEEIRRDFEQVLPELLHDLYTAVAHGLRTIPGTPPPTSIRMADAAHWLVAAEEGAGLPAGTILTALEKAQGTTQADLAMQDSLFAVLEAVLLEEDFEGRPAKLLDLLRNQRGLFLLDRYFPSTPSGLSTKLRRLRSSLEKAGIIVEFRERTHEGRHIRARMTDAAREAAKAAKAAEDEHFIRLKY
jgi:hypothetical protein